MDETEFRDWSHRAADWGAEVLRLEAAGHVNADSGLDDWPAGLSLLAALAGRPGMDWPRAGA